MSDKNSTAESAAAAVVAAAEAAIAAAAAAAATQYITVHIYLYVLAHIYNTTCSRKYYLLLPTEKRKNSTIAFAAAAAYCDRLIH